VISLFKLLFFPVCLVFAFYSLSLSLGLDAVRLGLVVFSLLFLVSGKTFITGSPLGNESEIILIGTGWLAALLFGTLSMPN